jgi:branched-chain amino acid transport system ATP-binding protein
VLKVSGIDVFYGDLLALRGVSLAVNSGEVVSVIGSNGAGKSTTLRTISGLLRPSSGQILFRDQDLLRVSPASIVEMGISHIPEGRQLFPTMSVKENLEMGGQFPHLRRMRKEIMEEIFGFFPRLRERMGQLAGTLSGGEQQMLAIGRGLMSRPALLMLDEPSLGLSPLFVSLIFKIVQQINENGTMIFLVEQNVFHALKLCTRAYILENGSIVNEGEGSGLLCDDRVKRAYLGI